MTESPSILGDTLIRKHPVFSYFVLAYAISWLGGAAVTASYWMHGEAVPKIAGLMMFPAMLLGPSIAGVALITVTQGSAGLRGLLSRMRRIGRWRWLATLAIPPVAVLCVLYGLSSFLSPVFAPNRFWIGLSFGCTAGFFEEIGWTGSVFPTMNSKQNTLGAATLLGVLWAAWHIPVVDFLGSATPHGAYWLGFLLAFSAAMTAIRVLICWIYCNTNSVLLAQMFHASSTGALAIFGPAGVTAGEEALWYAVYALVLWTIVACVIARVYNDARERLSTLRLGNLQWRLKTGAGSIGLAAPCDPRCVWSLGRHRRRSVVAIRDANSAPQIGKPPPRMRTRICRHTEALDRPEISDDVEGS